MKVKFRKMFIENRISIEINEKHENRKLSNVKLINREKDKFWDQKILKGLSKKSFKLRVKKYNLATQVIV